MNNCTDLDGHPLPCPPAAVEQRPVKAASSSTSLRWLPRDFLLDQKAFWTSPALLRERDLPWLLPFSVFTAGLIASDTGIENRLPTSPKVINRSRDFSNAGVAALIGAGGGLYLWGQVKGNDERRQTGLLAGEAALSSLAVTEFLKATTRRERPLEGDGKGRFWNSGDSFPSEHAAAAWSIASVLAHEYSGPLTQVLAYGLATGVTATRVTSRKHFASDAFIGSALGWYMGRQVYRAHHGEEPATANIGTFYRAEGDSVRQPENMGSPYVPLDTWIYPAFDRLAALGYVQTGFAGMRPWTRLECARIVRDAGELLEGDSSASEARRIYDSLQREFASEVAKLDGGGNLTAEVESVYTRFTEISGPPLRDSMHFGQTLINDFGRPYGEGSNSVVGASGWATAGPLAFYVRGEYQHAPSLPRYSDATQQAIAAFDGTGVIPGDLFPAVDRFRLLDTYVSLNVKNTQISFGKQSLWWGPGRSGPMMFSSNAEPVLMLRLSRVTPVTLPGPFRLLGPMRGEMFFGRLAGHQWIFSNFDLYGPRISDQPFLEGQKLTFKPTPNLEFGVSLTAVMGGPGLPMTLHNFGRAVVGSNPANETGFTTTDPGDRRSGINFSYRVPRLRNWLVLYNDSFADDDISPLNNPRRSAMNPGIYMPRLPKLPRVDFRLESVYTDLPNFPWKGFFYFNGRYRSGYSNDGNLLANWVGREGRGIQAWSTYWLSPQNSIQIGYRNGWVDQEFLGGGQLSDYQVHSEVLLPHDLALSGTVQYEHWNFPLVDTRARSNVATSIQLTYRPKLGR